MRPTPPRILTVLTYYTPHISGLTVYARRVVRQLVQRGYPVTVLTSHFRPDLPKQDRLEGASVVRSPVLVLVSKGALMPLFLWQAFWLIARHDLVYLHLPQFEAGAVALLTRLLRRPLVVSYQCDIILPSRLLRIVFSWPIALSHYLACALAHRIVTTSDDYADSSQILRRFRKKTTSVPPPIELEGSEGGATAFRERHRLGTAPLVGFVGRFAEEKGIHYLVDAVPAVLQAVPQARFVLAGPTDTVPGERVHERLAAGIQALGPAWLHLGKLSDEELTAFYEAIDVLVLPSTNSTESFGMTQAEAMLAGTPVVATDLPGVREAVRRTGMGLLVPPGDAAALADATVSVLQDSASYQRPAEPVRALFDPAVTAAFYERLFLELLRTDQAERASQATVEGQSDDESGPARMKRR